MELVSTPFSQQNVRLIINRSISFRMAGLGNNGSLWLLSSEISHQRLSLTCAICSIRIGLTALAAQSILINPTSMTFQAPSASIWLAFFFWYVVQSDFGGKNARCTSKTSIMMTFMIRCIWRYAWSLLNLGHAIQNGDDRSKYADNDCFFLSFFCLT